MKHQLEWQITVQTKKKKTKIEIEGLRRTTVEKKHRKRMLAKQKDTKRNG